MARPPTAAGPSELRVRERVLCARPHDILFSFGDPLGSSWRPIRMSLHGACLVSSPCVPTPVTETTDQLQGGRRVS